MIETTPVITDLAADSEFGRPMLTGTVRYVDTRDFRIFYTLSGEDAVMIEDLNGNAVPDYVEKVADALVYALEIEVIQQNWPAPPPDSGLGGDDRYDIYLKDLDWGYIGFAIADEHFANNGDNPNSLRKETRAISSFMLIDNNFEEYVDAFADYLNIAAASLPGELPYSIAEGAMRISVAHELMHMIQYGYDVDEPDTWIWEASASWAERIVYPELSPLLSDLGPAFNAPDLCQLSEGDADNPGHWYSEWLFIQKLSERYGSSVVRRIWESALTHDGYATVEAALQLFEATLDDEIGEYYLSLLLRDFDADLIDRVARLEGVIARTEVFRPASGVGQMGADYLRLDVGGIIDVRLLQLDDGFVVGIAEDRADIFPIENARIQVDADLYDELYLIVLNLDMAADITQCGFSGYQVSVSRGSDPAEPFDSRPRDQFLTLKE